MLASQPAMASKRNPPADAASLATYVAARAAELQGDDARSAQLYAAMAKADPANVAIARRAMVILIQSGDFPLAVSLAKRIPADELSFDGRLLLVADALRVRRDAEALALLKPGKTSTEHDLITPLVEAWSATARGRDDGVTALESLPATSILRPAASLQRIYMLLALKRGDEAAVAVAQILKNKGDGFTRQRLALAAGLQRNRQDAAAMQALVGDDGPLIKARALLAAGKKLPMQIDTPAKGYAELLLSLAADLARGGGDGGLPLTLARIAAYADPANSGGTLLSALFLDNSGRSGEAVTTLRQVSPGDILAGDALDIEARILSRNGKDAEALLRVEGPAKAQGASVVDISRLADILGELDRHDEAAKVYEQAISAAKADGVSSNLWTLHLLRASSLEEVERWSDAKLELQQALALEPENPVILNFLGYGKLERGEDLDAAEAMIRKASTLRPDDASITDSLGWALYKRGNLDEAIDTLRRAAAGDPAQSEIHEHLGDALFKSGRRIEARFSWTAALATAEDSTRARLQSKIDSGLDTTNAAP